MRGLQRTQRVLNLVLSNSSINTVFYKSPAFDAIMAATLKAPDEAARALYQQAEAQLDKDSALVPVYYRVSAFDQADGGWVHRQRSAGLYRR